MLNRERAREYDARNRERRRESNSRRLQAGNSYLGKADSPEQATQINTHLAMRLSEFKAKQREELLESLA